MTKIKVNTTLRNERYLDGTVSEGSVHSVPDDYAKELVEDKGFASYVEKSEEAVEIDGVEYPKDFLEMEIPPSFVDARVYKALDDAGIDTFGELVRLDDPTNIKGIGESFMEDIEKEIVDTKSSFEE